MDGSQYGPSPKRGARVFAVWRNEGMTSYRKRPRDSAQLAKLIDIAVAEVRDRESPKKTTTKRKPPSRKSSHTKAR
jgi:hypothetical protein